MNFLITHLDQHLCQPETEYHSVALFIPTLACRSLAKVWDDDDPAAVVAPLLLRLKKSIRCLAILTVKRFCGFFSNMQQQQL